MRTMLTLILKHILDLHFIVSVCLTMTLMRSLLNLTAPPDCDVTTNCHTSPMSYTTDVIGTVKRPL